MSDEAYGEICAHKMQYTNKEYCYLQAKLINKMHTLNGINNNIVWNTEQLGKALWVKSRVDP